MAAHLGDLVARGGVLVALGELADHLIRRVPPALPGCHGVVLLPGHGLHSHATPELRRGAHPAIARQAGRGHGGHYGCAGKRGVCPWPTATSITTRDRAAAHEFRAALQQIGGEEADVLERRGIDAGAAQWVVVAGLSPQGLRQLADFILQYRKLDKVARICVGDVEIDNLTPDLVERVLAGRGSAG